MKLYKRENYLKKIRGFYHDADMIKVLTGVRRCGKSSLMQSSPFLCVNSSFSYIKYVYAAFIFSNVL